MIEKIVNQFFSDKEIHKIESWGNGHINDTYKLSLQGEDQAYILQKINTHVFKNPQGLIENHRLLQSNIDFQNLEIEIPFLIPHQQNNYLFIDVNDDCWRIMNFIQDSIAFERIEYDWQAAEAGKAFGYFLKICSNLDATKFSEAIPDFHSLSFRIKQLKEAIKNNNADRLSTVTDIIDFYLDREKQLLDIESLIKTGEIPTRLVHNDTKLNNLLFRDKKAVAVIDLDTLGPGSIYFDYGDAIRTISNTSLEDETDLEKVDFDVHYFEHFTKPFIKELTDTLQSIERNFLYLAPKYMTYIMGIRFMADYLNGDVYYKTAYADHNLVRTKVQMKLIQCMEEKEETMIEIIKNI